MTVTEYIQENVITTRRGTHLVPDGVVAPVPARIRRSLLRRYGQPATIDGGELAYWTIDDMPACAR